jgi:hypothetical protein
MDGMNMFTLPAGPAGGWVGDGSRRRRNAGVSGDGGLPLLGRELIVQGLPQTASAMTRHAPKCAPDMYVWSSVDLRLIYA